jgi:hypothetical protein
MVRSYDDPVKQKAREKLKEFIRTHLISNKPAEHIKVVCFPGAEIEGEEALEVKEVYDSLGIPRENIVGLEYNAENAGRLKRADLGIEVVCQHALRYFSDTERVFDIVSLDYTGHQGKEEIFMLEQIAGKHLLGERGVLHTNYMGKRETDFLKKRLFLRSLYEAVTPRAKSFGLEKLSREEAAEIIDRYVAGEDTDSSLKNSRDIGISAEIMKIFKQGAGNVRQPTTLLSYPFSERINNNHFRAMKEYCMSAEGKKLLEIWGIASFSSVEELVQSMKNGQVTNRRLWLDDHMLAFHKYISFKTGLDEQSAKFIAIMLHFKDIKPYFVEATERYSYNSNKNALMITDLTLYNQHTRDYRKFDRHVMYFPGDANIIINPSGLTVKRWNKEMARVSELFYGFDRPEIPERHFLGSSWQSPKRKDKISKSEAVNLLRDGCSPAEIEDCFSGFSKMQLAALKAHYVTMGKSLAE